MTGDLAHDDGVFEPPAFHSDRPGLVLPVRIDPTGEAGPTRAQARGRRWRAAFHGWYVPDEVDADDPYQRILEASVLLPAHGAVTGWAALRWQQAVWFDGIAQDGHSPRPVPLATGGRTLRQQHGIIVSEERLPPSELCVVDGLRITHPLRSTSFEMRHVRFDDQAVAALDMAAFCDLVSIEEMAEYVARMLPVTGVPRCRRVVGLADENSWSPLETRMRLLWEGSGERPRPLCNVPVFDRWGRHVATPDLIDPVAGIVGEYEGSVHLVAARRAQDLRREHELRDLGLEYVTMVGADLEDPGGLQSRIAAAYERARRHPAEVRAWTIDPPSWWVSTRTVAERRALDEALRERLLAHRRVA